MLSKLFGDKGGSRINWRHSKLGDGTDYYLGDTLMNGFSIKQVATGWEAEKRNKATGVYLSGFFNTYEQALAWCEINNS